MSKVLTKFVLCLSVLILASCTGLKELNSPRWLDSYEIPEVTTASPSLAERTH